MQGQGQREKSLEMKLVSVKCLFDKTKIIFYFVADNRIDFRELVRDLATVFRTRIEMRQIGVRDEARIMGGFGPCGRELCCGHLKEEFEPVSIKMAKEQNLNLNSLKISGHVRPAPLLPGIRVQGIPGAQPELPKLGARYQVGREDLSGDFGRAAQGAGQREVDGDHVIRGQEGRYHGEKGIRYSISQEV